MRNFDDFYFFESVVRHRGFGRAARELGVAKSMLSRRVRLLEERLDARLIERTTSKFELTAIGEAVYRHSHAALQEMEAAESSAGYLLAEPRGTVRVSAPPGMPAQTVAAALPEFMALYPKVAVQLVVGMRRFDLIEERIDVALRARSSFEGEADLIIKRIGTLEMGMVASPAFIARSGTPESPEDLPRFATLGRDEAHPEETWTLIDKQGARARVQLRPRFSSNSFQCTIAVALGGAGIAFLADILTEDHVRKGDLVSVLPSWKAETSVFHMAFPSRRYMLPAVRLFVDFMSDRLRAALNGSHIAHTVES